MPQARTCLKLNGSFISALISDIIPLISYENNITPRAIGKRSIINKEISTESFYYFIREAQ
jgi:hypothetical protein